MEAVKDRNLILQVLKTYGYLIESELAEDEQKALCKEVLNDLTDDYFYGVALKKGGYKNMGEINYDADVEDDLDAKLLQELYKAIWKREEELEAQIDQMNLEELLSLNLKALVKTEYDEILSELEAAMNSQTEDSTDE